jgi:hypothetical protein
MKVKLLPKVHRFSQDGINYYPGDVFEVKGRVRLDFMLPIPEVSLETVASASVIVEKEEIASEIVKEEEEVEVTVKKTSKTKKPAEV